MKRRLQANVTPEEGDDLRKYEIGRMLTFRQYNAQEKKVVDVSAFSRGEVLVVLPRNGCGMGIDVVSVRTGKFDMVWPEEVDVRRKAVVP